MKNALIVFAKPPVAGRVKTRLASVLTEEEAARLYEAFLRDALAQYARLDAEVRLYLSPPLEGMPEDAVPEAVDVLKQEKGAGLGARMERAFAATFAAGFARVVVVGTDHPTLPAAFIEEAFVALQDASSVCIGPSEDGGYYLLGMRALYRSLFRGMRYSHAAVFEETRARAEAAGARLTILPRWYDVDTPADLRRLAEALAADPEAAPRTRQAMRRLQDTSRL